MDTLYDSNTGEMLTPEDLGISEDQYHDSCLESVRCAQVEGHIYVQGRKVYASD